MFTQRFEAGTLSASFPGKLESHIIDASVPGSFDLMAHAYDELFVKFFPLDNGGEPLEKWMARLSDQHTDSRYVINVVGENLNAPNRAQRVIRGISVGIYYREADVGLLAYNVVADHSRNMGIGKMMVATRKNGMLAEARKSGGILRGVFLECNNPARITAEQDSIDPAKRIAMYKNWGAQEVPIDYVCPDEAPGGGKVGTLVLLSFPHPVTGRHPGKSDIESYLRGFYQKHGIDDPDSDVDFQGMMRQLYDTRPQVAPVNRRKLRVANERAAYTGLPAFVFQP